MSDLQSELAKLAELMEQRNKTFPGHAGRLGQVGGSLPKGRTSVARPNPPYRKPPASSGITREYLEQLEALPGLKAIVHDYDQLIEDIKAQPDNSSHSLAMLYHPLSGTVLGSVEIKVHDQFGMLIGKDETLNGMEIHAKADKFLDESTRFYLARDEGKKGHEGYVLLFDVGYASVSDISDKSGVDAALDNIYKAMDHLAAAGFPKDMPVYIDMETGEEMKTTLKAFEKHEGRPGKVGGSLPKGQTHASVLRPLPPSPAPYPETRDMAGKTWFQLGAWYESFHNKLKYLDMDEVVWNYVNEQARSAGTHVETNLIPKSSRYRSVYLDVEYPPGEEIGRLEELYRGGEKTPHSDYIKAQGEAALKEALVTGGVTGPSWEEGTDYQDEIAPRIQRNWADASNDTGGMQDFIQYEMHQRMYQERKAEGVKNVDVTDGMLVVEEHINEAQGMASGKLEMRTVDERWVKNTLMEQKAAKIACDDIYKRTQEFFNRMGYEPDDEILVFRGQGYKPLEEAGYKAGDDIPGDMLKSRPLTSWSIDPIVAMQFRHYDDVPDSNSGVGALLVAKVKVKDIFSHAATGFGCFGENEVILPAGAVNEIKVLLAAR